MRSLLKLSSAIVKLYLRDKLTVVLSLALIVFMMVLFGLVMGDDEYQVSLPVVVVDQAGNDASRALVQQLRADTMLQVQAAPREASIDAALHRATAVAGLMLTPAYTGARDAQGRLAGMRIVTIEHPNKWTTVALDRVRTAIQKATGTQMAEPWRRVGKRIDVVKNRYIDFIFPGILAMAVMQACLAGGVVVLHAKQVGILRRLQLTPMGPATLLGGFISGRLIVVLIHLVVLALVAVLGFGTDIRASWGELALALLLGSAAFMSLGIMLAIVAPSFEGGNLMIQMLSLPMSFLCGIFFKLESIPDFMAWLPAALPLTYLVTMLRGMINYGTPIASFQTELWVLGGWLVATLAISLLFARRLRQDGA